MQKCKQMVHDVFGSQTTDAFFSHHLLSGVRIDQLIEFSVTHECDLAVVGHRKSRSGQRSLARRLAMIAPCSVWLVPEGAYVSISKVLAPIDFSDHAADSLEVATAIAKAAGLEECVAAHVFSDPSTVRYDERVDEIRSREDEAFKTFIASIEQHGVTVEPTYVEGNNVAGTLLYTAKRQAADLIVMSTRGRSRAASILLGSVTNQLMGETPVAMLAVKHSGAMLKLFDALQETKAWMQKNPKTN